MCVYGLCIHVCMCVWKCEYVRTPRTCGYLHTSHTRRVWNSGPLRGRYGCFRHSRDGREQSRKVLLDRRDPCCFILGWRPPNTNSEPTFRCDFGQRGPLVQVEKNKKDGPNTDSNVLPTLCNLLPLLYIHTKTYPTRRWSGNLYILVVNETLICLWLFCVPTRTYGKPDLSFSRLVRFVEGNVPKVGTGKFTSGSRGK